MDLKRKIEVAGAAVRSISGHDDEDLAVRSAALDQIDELIAAERTAMQQRVDDRIAESLG